MAFEKGHKRVGGGSRKGRPNKLTAALKDMILQALDDAGGVKYLVRVAKRNPAAFLTLLGKVLPTTLTGPVGDAPVRVITVRFGKGSEDAAADNPKTPERPQPAPLLN